MEYTTFTVWAESERHVDKLVRELLVPPELAIRTVQITELAPLEASDHSSGERKRRFLPPRPPLLRLRQRLNAAASSAADALEKVRLAALPSQRSRPRALRVPGCGACTCAKGLRLLGGALMEGCAERKKKVLHGDERSSYSGGVRRAADIPIV